MSRVNCHQVPHRYLFDAAHPFHSLLLFRFLMFAFNWTHDEPHRSFAGHGTLFQSCLPGYHHPHPFCDAQGHRPCLTRFYQGCSVSFAFFVCLSHYTVNELCNLLNIDAPDHSRSLITSLPKLFGHPTSLLPSPDRDGFGFTRPAVMCIR